MLDRWESYVRLAEAEATAIRKELGSGVPSPPRGKIQDKVNKILANREKSIIKKNNDRRS